MAFTPEQWTELHRLMNHIDELMDECHAGAGEILVTLARIQSTCDAITNDMKARRLQYEARLEKEQQR